MERFFDMIPTLVTSIHFGIGVMGIAVSWLVGNLLKKQMLKFIAHTHKSSLFIALAANISKALSITIGILFFMGILGINVGAIIQTIAVLGFGISFIFKDILSDMVAGFFIATYKPFTLGTELTVPLDKVVYTGTIKSIDLRYIVLESHNRLIFIPNSFLFRQPVNILNEEKNDFENSPEL